MRGLAAGVALGAVATAIAIASSCTVDRKSEGFACNDSSTCDSDRTCVDHFCVLKDSIDANDCPSPCTSCDVPNKQCTIDCEPSHHCGGFSCPSGYSCQINCNGNNACNNISCTDAASCNITCSTGNACDQITCGDGNCTVSCLANSACGDVRCQGIGACSVTCAGNGACGNVTCPNSCQCDVQCVTGSCGTVSCPNHGTPCTTTGVDGAPCDSAQPGCKTC